MRIARYLAVLVALATVGLALGDLASDPSPLGAIGLLVLLAVFGFLLAYLFRPERAPRPAAEPEPEPEPEAPRRKKPEPVWSGWNAEEAQVARDQRRERRR